MATGHQLPVYACKATVDRFCRKLPLVVLEAVQIPRMEESVVTLVTVVTRREEKTMILLLSQKWVFQNQPVTTATTVTTGTALVTLVTLVTGAREKVAFWTSGSL